jgi:tRNA(fMet)-specific endonuclease VapC
VVLFDTNCWITLLKGRCPALKLRWSALTADELFTCSIVKAELWHGARKYDHSAQRRSVVDRLLAPYRSIPFDDPAAECYAAIRHELEMRGVIIGPNDVKIAAICVAFDLTLITANQAEFSRVRGLRLEDWTAAQHGGTNS